MPTYWSDMCDRRTCVYRLWAADARLLYVGLSMNPRGRMEKHKRRSWWPDVSGITYEWFPNRTDAQDAERRAIHDENPVHNVTRARMECCS